MFAHSERIITMPYIMDIAYFGVQYELLDKTHESIGIFQHNML